MKKLISLLLLGSMACLPACAGTNNVTFILPSITGAPGYTQTLTLTPTTAPRGGDTGIITGTPVSYTVPAAGTITVTNLATGTDAYYRCTVRGLGRSTDFFILNSLTNFVTDAKTILVLNNTASGIYGWSTDAADARYAPLGDYETGLTTNLTEFTSQFGTAAFVNTNVFDLAGAAGAVQTNLVTHTNLTTAAHGGLVASTDARLTDNRYPVNHSGSTVTSIVATATLASFVSGTLSNSIHGNADTASVATLANSANTAGSASYADTAGAASSATWAENSEHATIASTATTATAIMGMVWHTNSVIFGDGSTNTIIYLSH